MNPPSPVTNPPVPAAAEVRANDAVDGLLGVAALQPGAVRHGLRRRQRTLPVDADVEERLDDAHDHARQPAGRLVGLLQRLPRNLLVVVPEPEDPHVHLPLVVPRLGRVGPARSSSREACGPARRQRCPALRRSHRRMQGCPSARVARVRGTSVPSSWMRACSPWSSSVAAVSSVRERAGEPGFVGDRAEVVERVRALEESERPRWLVPAAATSLTPLVAAGIRVQRCWDVAEAHRLLHGGWAADLHLAWAQRIRARPRRGPQPARDDLFDLLAARRRGQRTNASRPRPRGPRRRLPAPRRPRPRLGRHPRPAAVRWPRPCSTLAARQGEQLAALGARSVAAAHSESAAAALCLELEHDGLPVDRVVAERPHRRGGRSPAPRRGRSGRASGGPATRVVLAHAPGREHTDLRNPLQVRDLLAAVGVTVPSTRKGYLEPYRSTHAARRRAAASGARTSGSRRPTATAGSTSTSGPTTGCGAAGRRATGRRAG